VDAERNPGLNGVASRKSSPAAIETDGGSRSRPSTRGASVVATASPTPTDVGVAESDKVAREHRPPPEMAEGSEAEVAAAVADSGAERASMLADQEGGRRGRSGRRRRACEIAYAVDRASSSHEHAENPSKSLVLKNSIQKFMDLSPRLKFIKFYLLWLRESIIFSE
jgi:hypothetical protein